MLLQFDPFYSARHCCTHALSYYPSYPPSLSAGFFFVLFSFTSTEGLLMERLEQILMSLQFMEIPIVFSQCVTIRGLWVVCVTQHGFVYTNAHRFTPLTVLNIYWLVLYIYSTISVIFHLNVTTCHSVQTGPSTISTIWLTRRPLTDLFHNLCCCVYCMCLLW